MFFFTQPEKENVLSYYNILNIIAIVCIVDIFEIGKLINQFILLKLKYCISCTETVTTLTE